MGNTTGAVIALALGIGLAYIVLIGKGVNFANAMQVYTGNAKAVPNTQQQGGNGSTSGGVTQSLSNAVLQSMGSAANYQVSK